MTLPLASLGIYQPSLNVTKKQLISWTKTNTPHVVVLFTLGGIFTSDGDGIYRSFKFQFNSTEEFWLFARNHKQGSSMTSY